MKKTSNSGRAEPSNRIGVYVLAGARSSGDALADAHNVPSKAHIKVAGQSMILRVLNALSQSAKTDDITIIGIEDHEALQTTETWPTVVFAPGENGPAASVFRTLRSRPDEDPVLITTCDHALLSPAMVDDFLQRSTESKADLTVALARRETIEAEHPDTKRTYLRFGDGEYSSCNLFCIVTPKALRVVEFWRDAEKDRKRPWRIAWRFGVGTALRLLIGRPSLDRAFAILSRRLGVTIHPIDLPFAEAAIDVDTAQDLAMVEQILTERAK
ncbi:MAG: nucleotidyltransferase family protein [Pseudomonadota bacterium]